jgi:hypothetical protein
VGVQRLLLSEANRVRFAFPPALEVGVRAREVARAACDIAPPGTYVLASPSVSEQVAILPGCGHALIAAARWMLAPTIDREARERLARYVTADGDVALADAPWFLASLDHYSPRAVVVLQEALRNRRLKLLLRLAGYEKVAVAAENHVFAQRSVWQVKQDRKTASQLCVRTGKGATLLAPFGIAAALERRGQCRSLLAVRAARSHFDADADALAQLERLIATQSIFEQGEDEALRSVLLHHDVRGVALAPAAVGNAPVKQLLGELHYRHVGNIDGYRLFLRPAPAAPAP